LLDPGGSRRLTSCHTAAGPVAAGL